jgi:hypothetical protein
MARLLLASLPLAIGLWALAHVAATSQLNQDEFQHVHIAWETLQRKVIYRDFHEHHGPLTAWLGALVLKLRGAEVASFETIELFRRLNFAGVGLVCALVVLLVRRTGGSWAAGLVAAGLLSTSGLYAWVGVQYRPDTLQSVLVLASLLLLVERRDAMAGLCLGLLPAVHPKSLLAVGFLLVGAGLVGGVRWSRTSDRPTVLREEARRLAWLAGGLFVVQGVVVIAFAALGGLGAYVSEAWVANFGAVGRAAAGSGVAGSTRGKLWMVDAPGVLALLLVLLAAGTKLWRARREEGSERGLLVLGAALASLVTLALPFRAYILLLPMALAAAALGVASTWRVGRLSPAMLAASAAAGLGLLQSIPRLREEPNPERAMNRLVLDRVLSMTPREEQVFYVWPSRCSAYVFNADPVHYWRNTTRAVCDVASAESDARFERAFREKVIEGRTRYVALEKPYAERLPAEFRAYLREHFKYQGCLWERF